MIQAMKDKSNGANNSNTSTSTMDCPICTDPMTEFDMNRPVPCPGVCGFNFCLKCVEHLMETSKMAYEEASDGSRQMKVKLICPQVCLFFCFLMGKHENYVVDHFSLTNNYYYFIFLLPPFLFL
jgi:hypothetical protein